MKNVSKIAVFAVVGCLVALPGVVSAEEAVDVSGVWDLTWQGRQGTRTMEVTFEQEGEELSGKIVGPQGRATSVSGSITGDKIEFAVSFQTQRGPMEITYRGTVEGDSMKGTAEMRGNTRDWSAARKS